MGEESTLFLYDTLSGVVQRFEPLYPHRVKMFVCGPTIQDYLHIGHGRTYVFYDVLARLLRQLGYRVSFIMNITDIDDKVVEAARRSNTDFWSFTDRYTAMFMEDMRALRISTVGKYERASKYIQEMVYQISTLIEKGHAYVSDGDVYFSVATYKHYGQLSKRSLEELMLRPIELSPKKRSQVDFALWRSLPPEECDPCWDSPWGRGRPGWHIEDTAISITNFGPQYDIHGGGYELVYPHHEAEIAQAESFTGTRPFVKYWVHTGMLKIGGKKMSKSEGNVLYLRDALKKYGVDGLRWYFMSTHYREDVEFDESGVERSIEEYEETKSHARKVSEKVERRLKPSLSPEPAAQLRDALLKDLDTPRALTSLRRMLSEASGHRPGLYLNQVFRALLAAEKTLGVNLHDER